MSFFFILRSFSVLFINCSSLLYPKFDFDPYMIMSAHQLVSEAIIMDKPQTDDSEAKVAEEATIGAE